MLNNQEKGLRAFFLFSIPNRFKVYCSKFVKKFKSYGQHFSGKGAG